jgi:hypothetical protein
VQRQVALKIIKLGMDTRNVIARFKTEQQVLALMEHPNIAHVLDAGATATGLPYFVMELVRGTKLTEYCDANQLDVRTRMELFIHVCHAVQHAHQKGIIHRDLKPSNILVTLHDGVPSPKVIDFGIAKATEGRSPDHTLFTAVDQFVGTPAYMSPEQAESSGLDVDTRSDIYSLGVLLYELLTGRPPFEQEQLVKSGMTAMRRTLREAVPRLPSTLLTALHSTGATTRRHTESRKLISELRGDLDWIVMKALEKDRARRYDTANGMAQDVIRYLNQEVVLARPPSRIYRFRKLVLRNRVVFAAGAVVFASLVVGLGTSARMFFKEREARLEQVRLRQAAENREKLTKGMAWVATDQFAQADELIGGIPVGEARLEYAAVYRTLADWHTVHNRWPQASTRFAALFQMGEPRTWDVTSLDHLRYGAALVEAADLVGYERFRRAAIASYANTKNPSFADRIIKISLLKPADSELFVSLQPLAELASKSLANDFQPDTGMAVWTGFSLALMKYREGDDAGAVAMCKHWLEVGPVDSGSVRDLSLKVVLAMAQFRLGREDDARAELGRVPLDNQHANSPYVFWWDEVILNILAREARAMVNQ